MRTHADGPASTARPTPRTGPEPAPQRLPGDLGAASAATLTRGLVAQLQAAAGNRATTRFVVQRALAAEQADAVAAQLHEAMAGWGTDEEAVYGALSGRTPADIDAIRDAYLRRYDTTLQADINDDFSGEELARVNRLLQGTAAAPNAAPAEAAAAATNRAVETARHLHEAMEGLGTNEDEIFNALTGRSSAELNEVARQYATLTGHALEQDLVDELSGDDLRRALNLLGVVRTDVFSNEVTQHMTEGATTVVQGRFEWALTRDEMRVEAGVRFVPDPGVSPPYSDWNNQIASTWNNFAVVEPGGRRLPVNFSLRPDPGNDRTLAVHANTKADKWWEDRADAGNWYVRMTADTAPHEFGHLIGLEDEYQRTHGDIQRITNAAPAAGITNASGKTPAQIATELHAALTGEPRATRAAAANTCLRGVGLIDSNGVPQQGDFAQEVKTAYDTAYTPNLVDTMRDNMDREGRWTIQTVFSYATRTVMGNPEAISRAGAAAEPHDHGVLPRHLAEFARLVKGVWPQFDWTIGSR